MSETEAMDISSPGSTYEDIVIPGINPGNDSINNFPQGTHRMPGILTTAAQAAEDRSNMDVTDTGPLSKSGVRLRDDTPGHVDPDERPLKRARTLDAQPDFLDAKSTAEADIKPVPAQKNTTTHSAGLTPEQQAHCDRVLVSICKMTAATPFLAPVDPIEAKAPDYYQVITHPMDLGTIEKRLRSGKNVRPEAGSYNDLQEFVDDVNLVFDNCFKYNGSAHAVSQLAIRVKDAFEEGMKTAPGGESLKFIPVPAVVSLLQDSVMSPGVRQMSQSMSDLALKTASPPAAAGSKRRNPALPKSLPPTNLNIRSRRDPLRIAQEKFCKATLDHLYRAEYEAWALPFLGPVDLNAYPDYLTVVEHPMDFGTISDNLSHGIYTTPEAFQSDIKLVFSNCYAFNPTWAPVHDSAKKLEAVFDEKWKELPLTAPEIIAPPRPKRTSGGSNAPARPQKPKSGFTPRKSKKRPVLTSLNEEQRFSLCEALSTLPDPKMDQVIELIRKRMPQYRDNKEEMDLTIENIPGSVQAEMFEMLNRPILRGGDYPSSSSMSDSDDGHASHESDKGI